MRAAFINELGGLPVVGEAPDRRPAVDEILVEVLASALNPIDVAVASGQFFAGHPELPYVPGAEAVGRVVAGGDWSPGTLVYVSGGGFGTARDGGLAERAVAPAGAVIELPADADAAMAAALGIAGLAGWLPLAWRAPVRPTDRVLVLGATGTVGLVAVQAARLLGAERVVAAGRRAEALHAAAEAGADVTVSLDGDTAEVAARMRDAAGGDGPTYVFDPLWGRAIEAAVSAAAPGARIVNLGQSAGAEATLPSGAVRGKQLEIFGYLNFAVPADARADAHRRLLHHAASGELRIPLDVTDLDGVADAWRRQRDGIDRKLVVRIAAAGGGA